MKFNAKGIVGTVVGLGLLAFGAASFLKKKDNGDSEVGSEDYTEYFDDENVDIVELEPVEE